MTIIKNGNTEITLKASAGAYRKLKLMQGCLNLKAAFFAAYENIDPDFLIACIEAFGVDVTRDKAEAFVDGLFESGKLLEVFSEVANFLNGMGFFGVLPLKEGESVIDYFGNPLNKVDTSKAIASAMDNALNTEVSRSVRERIAEDKRKNG